MPGTRKKIAFLITDLLLGGTPLLLRTLAEGLARQGLEPTIISLKPFPAKQLSAFGHAGFEFESSLAVRHSASPIPVYALNLHSPRDFPRGVRMLAKFLNQLAPDILFSMLIHANTLASLTVPFLDRRPLFFQSLQTLQEKPGWHWNLQGILSPYADAVVVPSAPILEKISRYGNLKNGVVIANGIDVERFAGAMPIENPPWPKDSVVLGYVGRFDPVKNLPLLLRAFARLPKTVGGRSGRPLHLALVGYGSQEEELKKLSISLHLAPHRSGVHFLGATSVPERWYKSFDIHVLPSDVEGFGLTLVEAMAAGIRVVAPDTAVARSIVRPGIDGLLFEPNSEASLVVALQTLIRDQAEQCFSPSPETPSAGYVRAQFSAEEMVRKYLDFFKNFRS